MSSSYKNIISKTHNYHFDVIIGSNDTSLYKIYKKSKKIYGYITFYKYKNQ